MYTLPDDFEFDFLAGCYLETVCFGISVTKLDFARPQAAPGVPPYKVSICIEDGLSYQVGGVSGARDSEDSSSSAPLLELLLKDVLSVEKVDVASLKIVFKSGDQVMIDVDPSGDYESCSIYLNSGDIVVI